MVADKIDVDYSLLSSGEIGKLTAERMLKASEEDLKKNGNGPEEGLIPPADIYKALSGEEDGDSDLFVWLFKDKFLFDHAAGSWYYWNEHYWRLDEVDHVTASVRHIIAVYQAETERQLWAAEKARQKKDDEEAGRCKYRISKLTERRKLLHCLRRKKNVLTLSRSGVKTLGTAGKHWDENPMLLGVKNGCLNLETGAFSDGAPGDYIKTVSPAKWEGIDEPCPTWDQFMLDIFDDDFTVVEYMQRLLGYGITGQTTEHVYPILWGAEGRNGKSTMLETLKLILGDLAYKAPSDFLMQTNGAKPSSDAPDASLMAMMGRRLVWCAETDDGRRLDTSKMKEMVGADTISGRLPYGKRQVEFRPSHLLMLITNNRPKIPANDSALWRRIHLIEFALSFVENPQKTGERQSDKNLPEKLKLEASGILAWLVRGCLQWQEVGLCPPASINDSTAAYREDEDILGGFVSECCIKSGTLKIKRVDLYHAYKTWAKDSGHNARAKKRFFEDMRTRFDETKSDGIWYFSGVGVYYDWE